MRSFHRTNIRFKRLWQMFRKGDSRDIAFIYRSDISPNLPTGSNAEISQQLYVVGIVPSLMLNVEVLEKMIYSLPITFKHPVISRASWRNVDPHQSCNFMADSPCRTHTQYAQPRTQILSGWFRPPRISHNPKIPMSMDTRTQVFVAGRRYGRFDSFHRSIMVSPLPPGCPRTHSDLAPNFN